MSTSDNQPIQKTKFHLAWVYFVTHIIPVVALIVSSIALYETNEADKQLIQAQIRFENEIAEVAASIEVYRGTVTTAELTKKAMMALKFVNYSTFYDCFHKTEVSNFLQSARQNNKKRFAKIEQLALLANGTRFRDLFGARRFEEVQCMLLFNIYLYKKGRLGNYCPSYTKINIPYCIKLGKMYPQACVPHFNRNTFNDYNHESDRWGNCIADKLDLAPSKERQKLRQPLGKVKGGAARPFL